MGTRLTCPNCQRELFFEFLNEGDEFKCPHCEWRGSIPEHTEHYDSDEVTSSYKAHPHQDSAEDTEQFSNDGGPLVNRSESKFQTTTDMGKTVSAAGWTIIVLSIVGGICVFAAVSGSLGLVLGSLLLLVGILQGLLIVVNGQLLQAIICIENNTDKAAQLLEKLLHASKKA